MPAPSTATYEAVALIAAHTSFRDVVDGGSGAGLLRIRNSSDTLLYEAPLDDPCGTVNGTTGQLTLTMPSTPVNASANGTAAYAQLCTSAGTVCLSVPTQAGTTPVSGYLVLNTLVLASGSPVSIVSMIIG